MYGILSKLRAGGRVGRQALVCDPQAALMAAEGVQPPAKAGQGEEGCGRGAAAALGLRLQKRVNAHVPRSRRHR